MTDASWVIEHIAARGARTHIDHFVEAKEWKQANQRILRLAAGYSRLRPRSRHA